MGNVCFHRYFSHASFKTSRFFQATLAALGAFSNQRGALWWCSTHYKHHLFCDLPEDPHTPVHKSFLYSHAGWLLDRKYYGFMQENLESKYPVNKYPELYLIEIFSNAIAIMPLMFSGCPYLCMLALSLSVHLELAINSICHFPLKQEKQKQENDKNQNSCHAKDVWWVGVLNGGEGFHGAHHDRPRCAYHGRRNKAYNLDVAYLIVCGLESLGVCWDVVHDEGDNEIIEEKNSKKMRIGELTKEESVVFNVVSSKEKESKKTW
jgi:stearoyl-CoA desaturase (delta-9 desaturase)